MAWRKGDGIESGMAGGDSCVTPMAEDADSTAKLME
jgi:hypothetical protein